LQVLEQKGFIEKSRVDRTGKFPELHVSLKENKKDIELKRTSKAGLRRYYKAEDIKPVMNGYGISIITTSKGVMTGEDAKKEGIGGEPICEVY
jgi:small subunit ribosomal protein S8